MLILALESSAVSASCALLEDGKLLAESFVNTVLTHSRTLLQMTEHMMQTAGRELREVDLFAVTTGPGSFTGVRIGVATVKGMAYAAEKPCIGISTLESMAEECAAPTGDFLICAVMDARCRQVYNALFSCADGEVTRLTEDRAISLEDLKNELKNEKFSKKSVLLVGDGANLCYNDCLKDGMRVFLTAPHHRYQNASCVALLAEKKQAEAVSAEALEVSYLRPPQAVRMRSQSEKE